MYLNIKSLIICSALAVMCASACRNKGQEGEVVVSETMTEEVSAESGAVTVAVTETDALKMYKPVRDGGIWLHREPTRDSGRVFIAAAAYTHSYDWSDFNHTLIAGAHIDGKYYKGYGEPAVSGAFYYVNSTGEWGFIRDGFSQILKNVSETKRGAVGFSQVLLLYDGSVCAIHSRANPDKSAFRRALCELEGDLYVIDSKRKMTMHDFAATLKSAGVLHALYMDMGSMRYSCYRERYDGDWTEIHPSNPRTKHCTNYLVFHCAEL